MITNLVNGKRVLIAKHIGVQLENLLSFFSEINFVEEYLTSSEDTVYYRFYLKQIYINLSFFKRGFYVYLHKVDGHKIFEHEYSNKIWTRRFNNPVYNQNNTIHSHYIESDISPILTSLLDDIRYTWEISI